MERKPMFGVGLMLLGSAVFANPVSALPTTPMGGATSVQQSVGKNCSGVITDDADEPVIGATVTVKNSRNGGVTDLDGRVSSLCS